MVRKGGLKRKKWKNTHKKGHPKKKVQNGNMYIRELFVQSPHWSANQLKHDLSTRMVDD